ncbi:unnamed protein product, partial [Closterium sp. Naga37s-1]
LTNDVAPDGDHPAKELSKEHDKPMHGISKHMRPVICLQRCGLSALMGGENVATTADVLYYFMMNAPAACKRLMRAAKEAGANGANAVATAELHLESYGRQFDSRANDGVNAVTTIMGKADRELKGLVYDFPAYKEDHRGRLRPVAGNGWGGPRKGKAFEEMRTQGDADGGAVELDSVPIPTVGSACTIAEGGDRHVGPTHQEDAALDHNERTTTRDKTTSKRPKPVPRGWSAAPSITDVPEYTVCLLQPKHLLETVGSLQICCTRAGCSGSMALVSWKTAWACFRLYWYCNTCTSGREVWSSPKKEHTSNMRKTGPRTSKLMPRFVGAFALAGVGFQVMWEVCRNLGLPNPGKGTFYRLLQGEDGLWNAIIRAAQNSMGDVRTTLSKRVGGVGYISVDGRWSQAREAEWCTVSFLHPESRKILHVETTKLDVDDDSAPRLESVGFKRGMDFLKEQGFEMEGIVTDEGSTFRGAAVERGIRHQIDWWHKRRSVVKRFENELQNLVRKVVDIDNAETVEDLHMHTLKKLKAWLLKKAPSKAEGKTGKDEFIETVCSELGIVYRYVKPADAKWMHLELQQVTCAKGLHEASRGPEPHRSEEDGEDNETVDIPVMLSLIHEHGVPAHEGTGDGGDAVEMLEGPVSVEVCWRDVEELWGYDIHPEHGLRPSSQASLVVAVACNGARADTDFLGEPIDQAPPTTPQT